MKRARTRFVVGAFVGLAASFTIPVVGPAAGDSPPMPPPINVRCAGVTHLAVGSRVPLSVLHYGPGKWLMLREGVTFAVEPTDVAEVTAGNYLVGRRPGRVQVKATLPGVGTSMAETIWVVETLEGGSLPRLVGLKDTRAWIFDWLVGPDVNPGLRLEWEGPTHKLYLAVEGLPAGPPPWSLPLNPARTRYAPFEPHRGWDASPAPRRGTLKVDAWTAGVAKGRVDLEQADGTRFSCEFTAALPMPLHPLLVERLIATEEGRLTVGATEVRSVRARPRTAPAKGRLLLVPPATGLDDAVFRNCRQFAGHGFEVLAVDIYAGATAPDPTVLAEGHVPRDARAADERTTIALAMEPGRVQAVLGRAFAVLGAAREPGGAAPPRGVVAWGEACPHVALAVAGQPGGIATVLIDPPPGSGEALLGGALGDTCFVLGTRGNPAAGVLADALRRAAPAESAGVDVHAFDKAGPGFADPRWHLHYGPEETQAAHARILAFLDRRLR